MSRIGRNAVKCARYRAEARREVNKDRKLRKHIRRHPNDFTAREALG